MGGDRSLSVTGKRTVTVTQSNTETYKNTRKVEITGTNTFKVTGAHDGTYESTRTSTITGLDHNQPLRRCPLKPGKSAVTSALVG